MFKLINNTRYM